MIHRKSVVGVFGFCLMFLCHTKAWASGKCSLPLEVAQMANQQFPKWHLVTLGDISEKGRIRWEGMPDAGCPGLLFGQFSGLHTTDIAFALRSPDNASETVQLYVGVTKKLVTVDAPHKTHLSVLYLCPPYDSTGVGGFKSDWDSVGIGPPQGLARRKYWNGKQFLEEEMGD